MVSGSVIGRLVIRIVGDASGLRKTIEDEVNKAKKAIADQPAELPIEPKIDDEAMQGEAEKAAKKALDKVQKEVSKDENAIVVSTTLDDSGLVDDLDDTIEKVKRRRKNALEIRAEANEHQIKRQMERVRLMVRRAAIGVPISVEPQMQPKALDKLRQQYDKLSKETFTKRQVSIGVSVDRNEEQMRNLQTEIERVSANLKLRGKLEFDNRQLAKAVKDAAAYVDKLDNENTAFRIQVLGDRERAKADADAIKKIYDDFFTRMEYRQKRFELSSEVLGRKLKLAFSTVALGGLLAGVGSLGSLLAGGTANAVALTGALSQMAGGLALIPALVTSVGASIGVLIAGFNGFGAAMKEVFAETPDPTAFNKALEKLTPAAREAALAVQELRPVFTSLRETIQESLFTGLDGAIKRIGSFAEAMRPSLASIARGWSSIFQSIGIGLDNAGSRVGFGETFNNLGKAMTILSVGFPPLIRGFAQMSRAGSAFFDNIAVGLLNTGVKFEGWVGRITSDGTFDRWVNNAKSAFLDLYGTVKNVSGALNGVFQVAGGAGLLNNIRSLTKSFRDFTNSAKGGEQIAGLFFNVRSAMDSVFQIVKPLVPMFNAAATGVANFLRSFSGALPNALRGGASAVESLGRVLTSIGPDLANSLGAAVDGIGKLANDLGPSIGRLAKEITPLITELSSFASGAGSVFIGALTDILGVVNSLLSAVPGLATIMGVMFAGSAIQGQIMKVAGAFQGTSTAVGALATAAQGAAAPVAAVATGVKDAGGAAKAAAGGMTVVATGTSKVGAEATKTSGKFGSMVKTLGSKALGALPFVGVAIAGFEIVKTLIDSSSAQLEQYQAQLKSATDGVLRAYTTSTAAFQKQMQLVNESQKKVNDEAKRQADIRDMKALEGGYTPTSEREETRIFDAAKMAKTAVDAYRASLTEAERASLDMTIATNDLRHAIEEYGVGSQAAKEASERLATASWDLAIAKKQEADATRTAADAQRDQLQAQASLLGMEGDAAAARLRVKEDYEAAAAAIATYGRDSDQAKVAVGALSASVMASALAAGESAKATAVASGASNGAAEAYQAQMQTLMGLSAQGGIYAEVANDAIGLLQQQYLESRLLAQGYAAVKDSIVAVPDAKTIILSDNSPATIQRMKDLGFTVEHLPGGNIKVTMNDQVTGAVQGLVRYINSQRGTITVYTNYANGTRTTTNTGGQTRNSGGGLPAVRDGGYIDAGSHGRVDDVPAMLARGEYVINAAAVRQIGIKELDRLNSMHTPGGRAKVGSAWTGKFNSGGAASGWFDRALATASEQYTRTMAATNTMAPVTRPGHTFNLPPVDARSLAREIDRLGGIETELLGAL